jgi:hypothetical protein
MHSDLINKIEKARRYEAEPERITIQEISARFHGGNNDHVVTFQDGHWACDCTMFRLRHVCAHTMALQKILVRMLPAATQSDDDFSMHSDIISMVEKARRYEHEPNRIVVDTFVATFRGSNNNHTITLKGETWHCDCESFRVWSTCAHVMAIQRLLMPMLSPKALQSHGPVAEDQMAGALS